MDWVGIDVAKRTFAANSTTRSKTFPMDAQGYRAFRRWAPKTLFSVCLEASGPYWFPLADWLEKSAIPYAVVNPRLVRRFAQASEHRSKTDQLDAELIRRYAQTFQPEPVPLLQGQHRQLRCFSRRILQLQMQIDLERDRLEKASADPNTPEIVLASFACLRNELSRLLEDLEHRAQALILDEPNLRKAWNLLRSIPGVGDKTTRTLLAEYGPRLLTASPKQMTRYAGLDVVLFESGSSVRRRPRISKQGNWRVRRSLYLAALSAIQHNPTLAPYYQRKCHQGLEKKQALVAVMRKLLHLVHGVLKSNQPFQPMNA